MLCWISHDPKTLQMDSIRVIALHIDMTSVWSILRPNYLSDGRCNSSSPEAGVLTAISGCGPTPPEGGTHYHRQRALKPLFYSPGNREPVYLTGSFSSVYLR
ncbi:hypothetical protein AVEN_109522-1 [Araneus ventricosus]|uniref:Uncharacterized protein n=1 Tax=Araneus ventricosus TaxID=182803 RepID=A0A4Y2LUI0_ARAVE|nr:hypothetical protein AVEN_109522-1 [Araneus ventricosus]